METALGDAVQPLKQSPGGLFYFHEEPFTKHHAMRKSGLRIT